MKVVREGKRQVTVERFRVFDYKDEPGGGYMFPCNVRGSVSASKLIPIALRNYYACRHDFICGRKVEDKGIKAISNVDYQPTVIECDCGAHVELRTNSNQCECGRWYNMSGQLLVHPRFWGEETGETAAEIRHYWK